MGRLFFRWLAVSAAFLAAPYLIPGIHVESLGAALAAALALSVLNLVLKPLFVLLTLPFTLVTFGLFLLVVNALVFQLAAALVRGVVVEGFGSAFLGALLVSLVNCMSHLALRRDGERPRVVVLRDDSGPRRFRDVTPRD